MTNSVTKIVAKELKPGMIIVYDPYRDIRFKNWLVISVKTGRYRYDCVTVKSFVNGTIQYCEFEDYQLIEVMTLIS